MVIQRTLNQDLLKWKNKPQRMPLLLRGARQVGKTHLIREFGQQFSAIHEINFQKDPSWSQIFKRTNDPQKIIESLEVIFEKKINLATDLLFFDEIQDGPEALNSLKFFAEDCPQAFVVGAGSLLGIYLSQHSFPVGKVEFLTLFPLSFFEFLQALGFSQLAQRLLLLTEDNNQFHPQWIQHLKTYFILGGMPKVITIFLEQKNYQQARETQEHLLLSYKSDFAKYSGSVDALKILNVFENIPRQLAKENRKFQFNLLKKGGRYSEFQSSIDWLTQAGLSYKVPILSSAEIPLKNHIDENIFKLYFFDVGLLGALAELPISIFYDEQTLFKTFKGAFTENFFAQEFKACRHQSLYSWQSNTSEVDFLVQRENQLSAIEVKSGQSGKLKSLNVFAQKYPHSLKTRCSLLPLQLRSDTDLRSIPLYFAGLV